MTDDQPTQVRYPWKAAARTAFQTLVATLAILGVAAPLIADFVAQFWPGSPVALWIVGVATFISALATVLSRLMAIEGIDRVLARIGLGAEPK